MLGDIVGFPAWVLIILIVFGIAWIVTAALLVYRRRRIYNYAIDQARGGVVICMGDEARQALERSVFVGSANVVADVAPSRNPLSSTPASPASRTERPLASVGATDVTVVTGPSDEAATATTTTTTTVVVNVDPSEGSAALTQNPIILARPIAFPSADPVSDRYISRINAKKILSREARRRAAERATLERTGVLPVADFARDAVPTPLSSDELYAAALVNPYQGNDVARGSLMQEDGFVSENDDAAVVVADDGSRDAERAAFQAENQRAIPSAYPHRHICRHNLEEQDERINGEQLTFHSCGEGCVYFYKHRPDKFVMQEDAVDDDV